MQYEEVVPYLNKIVQINLKNKKRKVGWLVVDHYHEISQEPLKEVHCVKVRFGVNHIHLNKNVDILQLTKKAKTLQIEDIIAIRSCM